MKSCKYVKEEAQKYKYESALYFLFNETTWETETEEKLKQKCNHIGF